MNDADFIKSGPEGYGEEPEIEEDDEDELDDFEEDEDEDFDDDDE